MSVQLGSQGIQSGRLRPLAFATKQGNPRFPDVPTVDESGERVEAVSWYGMFVPAGTPKPVIDAINADIQAVFKSAEFKEKVAEPRMLGQLNGSAEVFGAFVKAESDKWRRVVEQAGLRVE